MRNFLLITANTVAFWFVVPNMMGAMIGTCIGVIALVIGEILGGMKSNAK